MKIWFVSIFENTPVDDNQNTRYNSLVKEALRRGHSVTYWASTFKHNIKEQRYGETTVLQPAERLELRFVKSAGYSKNISFSRFLSHRGFAKSLVKEFDTCEKPDLIMIAYPPITVAEKVSVWSVNNNIPCIVDIIDPWPDVFSEHIKYMPEFLLAPLKSSVRKTMQKASAVTGISNQYIEWAKGYNSALLNTRCFYPAVQFDEMQKELKDASLNTEKEKKALTVIYAGSLGYSYDIKTILEAAEKLEKNAGKDLQFIIAGDGPQKKIVEEYEKNHGNLTYVGRVPKKKLMEYYYLSDVGLTQHIEGATQSVTYKLFDLLACGLPIMNSLESEMKDIILNNRVGLHNSPGDAEGLAENLVKMINNRSLLEEMSLNSIKLTKEKGDSGKVYAEFMDFLESLHPVSEEVVQ